MDLSLSSEDIVKLVRQHLACKNASRLPVLVVAAAYKTAESSLAERIQPLHAHNAADSQTGSLGDIEVYLTEDNRLIRVYEMKDKQVTRIDIDIAASKVAKAQIQIDSYVFITTDTIEPDVLDYASNFHKQTGVEMTVLDCVEFLRHFLNLFHRSRLTYLDQYQELVLQEPASAVSQALKEKFLALRARAASQHRQ